MRCLLSRLIDDNWTLCDHQHKHDDNHNNDHNADHNDNHDDNHDDDHDDDYDVDDFYGLGTCLVP